MTKKLTEKQVGYLKSSFASGEFVIILVAMIILAVLQFNGHAPQEVIDRGGKLVIQAKGWITETLFILLPVFFAAKRMVLKLMQMWTLLQKYKIDQQANPPQQG